MDLETKMVMSIIVPCLNEEEVLPLFYQALEALRPYLETEIEYVFVDDGSSDGTLELLKAYREQNPAVHYLWQRSSPLCRLAICDRRFGGGDGCRPPRSSEYVA